MGMSPKTKADCDRQIASEYSRLATLELHLAHTKAGVKTGNLPRQLIDEKKGEIARCKAKIQELKALKRTLK